MIIKIIKDLPVESALEIIASELILINDRLDTLEYSTYGKEHYTKSKTIGILERLEKLEANNDKE